MKDALDHIRTISLSDLPIPNDGASGHRTEGRTTPDEGVVVVEGILIAQGSDLSALDASDVRDSLLFAQLAADYEAPRTTNPQDWYDIYSSTLSTLGWAEASHSVNTSDQTPPINWERALLGQFPSGNRERARSALSLADAMREDAPARLVWSRAVAGNTAINFAVAVAGCHNGSPGLVEVRAIAAMQFDQNGFCDWATGFKFDLVADRRNLNEDVYEKLRGTVKERLGDKVERYIIAVD